MAGRASHRVVDEEKGLKMNAIINRIICLDHGTRSIPHRWIYMLVVLLLGLAGPRMGGASEVAVQPDPLLLLPRHSADITGDRFEIDSLEAEAVLSYWRAGGYGISDSSADGYEAAGTNQAGLPHSADYDAPFWEIGFKEVLRFMGLQRAQQYRFSPAGPDGFAPVPDKWAYIPPAEADPGGIIRYVSVDSDAPSPPYDTIETAAMSILDALAVAEDGDLILVMPGIYNQGSVSNQFGLSRIAITSGVTVASIGGPAATIIEGSVEDRIRGALLNHPQARLIGVTLRYGATVGNAINADVRDGGGLLVRAAAQVSDCWIHDNTTLSFGSGGGAQIHGMIGVFQRNRIWNNNAYTGGGLRIMNGLHTIVSQCEIAGNFASHGGGGMSVDNCRNIYNVIVRDNHSNNNGGGITFANNADVWNSTITGNTAVNSGAGVYMAGTLSSLRNCILWDNHGGDIFAVESLNTVRFSLFAYDPALEVNLVSNVYEVPLFENLSEGNLRLRRDSSGINQGEFSSWMNTYPDMDGSPRQRGAAPDIGAYELALPAFDAQSAFYIPGEPVDVVIEIDFTSSKRPLTLGFQPHLPTGWSNQWMEANFEFEASPDGLGYVVLGDLPEEGILTITLVADEEAAGEVEFDVRFFWMLNGMETVVESGLQPAPYYLEPLQEVQFIAGEGGTVSSEGGWFVIGSEIELDAIADPGWRFSGWTGDIENAVIDGSNIRLIIDGPISIQAEFIRVFELSISSSYGSSEPMVGTHVYDIGSMVEVSMLTTHVTEGGSNYICTGWIGTGSVPASGSEREVSFTIEEASTITWQWSWFEARHASRGYRAAGRMMARIQCQVIFDPADTIIQVWWRPLLPSGWEIVRVEGDGNPGLSDDGLILINESLEGGALEFFYDVRIPDEATGFLELGAEAGLNDP